MNGVVLVLNLGAPAGQAALSLHFLLFPKDSGKVCPGFYRFPGPGAIVLPISLNVPSFQDSPGSRESLQLGSTVAKRRREFSKLVGGSCRE